jgi:AraC-like DNA-binding protein
MRKKSNHIPVNTLPAGTGKGIIIARSSFNGPPDFEEVVQSHRDSGYSFILQEKGTTHIEIDFRKHVVKAPALIYIHPNQVHRLITFKQATISSWIVTAENLQPEYLNILENIAPANVLPLTAEGFEILVEATSLCIKLSERKQEQLHDAILKESCNTLVALVASQYLAQAKPTDHYSRFEVITKAFKSALEQQFTTVKSPTEYASALHISTPYLNECVKNTTGHAVSWHIQQRVVLEAKRMLYHSDKSIKEIADELGYEDHSYFTRLFVKVTGVTPVAFRNKNFE